MLLTSIHASNFMKYEHLKLDNLPTRGLIGIFGANESGKSTIGEAVSFALFGATPKCDHNSLVQLINWDAAQCEVKVGFVLGEEQYRVVRYLNRKGDMQAALYKDDRQLNNGNSNVTKQLERLVRFNFEDFCHTFYLAQNEIGSAHRKIEQNSADVVQKMLGFNALALACDALQKDAESIEENKQKCSQGLSKARSLINEIKTDNKEKENLERQIEDLETQSREYQEDHQNLQIKIKKSKELLELRKQLDDAFVKLERSFIFHFHKEKLEQAFVSLSHLHAALDNEKTQLTKNKSKIEGHRQTVENNLQEVLGLREHLQQLLSMVVNHAQLLQKRLTISQQKDLQENSDNLQIALQREKQNKVKIGKKGVILLSLGGIAFVIALISLGQILLFHKLWWLGIGVVSCLILLLTLLGIFSLQKKLQTTHNNLQNIATQIKTLQDKIEICDHFSIEDLSSIDNSITSLQVVAIHDRFVAIKKQFSELFFKNPNLESLQQNLQTHQEELQRKSLAIQKRLATIVNLQKLFNKVKSDILPQAFSDSEDSKLLEDLQLVEQKIEQLLDDVHNARIGLIEFDNNEPLEIDSAWQKYEQYRIKFRKLSGESTIGGGTGMLNRIQTAFRQKKIDKLEKSLAIERDSFFSSLLSIEELCNTLQQEQSSQQQHEQQLLDSSHLLQRKKKEYIDCIEQLNRRKSLIERVHSLNQRLEELEQTAVVNKVTIDLLEKTSISAANRFAPSISKVMSRILPQFTNGRYQHVRVDEEFSLQAFCKNKSDFIEMTELSGGTVDQLFLALRLAFSQAVVAAKIGKKSEQFLFFDEPLTSFDEERSTSFLKLISEYSNNLNQIFVISPRPYSTKNLFNFAIYTASDTHKLVTCGKAIEKNSSL